MRCWVLRVREDDAFEYPFGIAQAYAGEGIV